MKRWGSLSFANRQPVLLSIVAVACRMSTSQITDKRACEQTMALRQRRHNGTNRYDNDRESEIDSKRISDNSEEIDKNTTLMDEDDQATLIQQIHDEYLHQSERLEKVFKVLCRFIIPALSVAYTIFLNYHETNQRNSSTEKPSTGNHAESGQDPPLQHQLITLRYIHLILNIIVHWYIPKAILRKLIPPTKRVVDSTTTTPKTTSTGSSETTVSLTSWYGVYLPYFLTLLITAISHWMIRQQQSHSHHKQYETTQDVVYNYYHSTLCISATIFILSAWYIQRDHHEHLYEIINDLKLYKYQYKSL